MPEDPERQLESIVYVSFVLHVTTDVLWQNLWFFSPTGR